MGEVFLARGVDGEPVVIKRVLPQLREHDEVVELFLTEARIASSLDHPNVAKIFEVGEVFGQWYLALEYIAGADLSRVRDAHAPAPLPLPIVCRVLADAARGLDHAHRARDRRG